MQRPIAVRRTRVLLASSGLLGLITIAVLTGGCLQVGGDEPLVRVENRTPPPQPVDTSRVQVNTVDDARQKLAEAYARNDYLEQQNAKLQRDKEELKADLKKAKSEREMYKDRYEKAIGKD